MKINFDNVVEAYNGMPGCLCGCKGHSHRKDVDKTGAVRIVNRMNKLIKNGYEHEFKNNQVIVKTVSRIYIAYYKHPIPPNCIKKSK